MWKRGTKKMKRPIVLLLVLTTTLFATPQARAQFYPSWDEVMQELAEEAMEGAQGSSEEALREMWEQQQELLQAMHEHPMDLNSATRKELLELPFLSEKAVEGLVNYRARYGPLRSLGELLLVPELSRREGDWLRHFVRLEEVKDTKDEEGKGAFWGRGRHELLVRADVPLYERQGWPWGRGIGNRWRYNWKQGRHLDVGLHAETDAGESMMSRETPFWDSYGGHVRLRDCGVLEQAIVGDYKAGFGEGLVVNNGLRFGKLTTTLWRTAGGIHPHSSTDEASFLRGGAAIWKMGGEWRLTTLYSFRKLDATTAADGSVQSINTSGYHRTAGELRRQGTLGNHTAALHAGNTFRLHSKLRGFQAAALRLGATALFQYYDRPFRQDSILYRFILPEGQRFGAVSVDYGFRSQHLYVSGETSRSFATNARGDRGGWATLNKVAWRFSAATQLVAIQRFYSQSYFSALASAFGEGSRVQNESGITLQLDADRMGPFGLRALVDYFYSPWPRYSMSRSSEGWEGQLQASYATEAVGNLVVRYGFKSKERSDQRHLIHRLRATYVRPFSERWTAQLAAFFVADATAGGAAATSRGYALAPRTDFTSRSQRLRLSVFGVLFRTTDFSSRLFLYEPSLLQNFGMLQLYGRGQRFGVTLRWQSKDGKWTAQTKIGATHYTDRTEISSDFLRIASPWKADVQVVARMLLR